MSKNITIQEGGVAKQLTVDKLKTNLVSSGTCLWVPEDEVQLTTKTITENGTYRAADDGYYGYSEVIVSGQGTATGTDGDGDEAVAHTDPGTGELVIDKVPSSIRVITPPTNPYGIYQDGQAISTDGMVVKAYLETGGEYGTVPNGEITLNPSTAAYDASTDHGGYEGGGLVVSSYIGKLQVRYRDQRPFTVFIGDIGVEEGPLDPNRFIVFSSATSLVGRELCLTQYNGAAYGMTPDGNSMQLNVMQYNGGTTFGVSDSFAEIGAAQRYDGLLSAGGVSSVDPTGKDIEGLTPMQRGSTQTITVSWPRPLDGKVLETTFEILVAPPYSSGEE